jgi:maleylacetoacetate isomerase
VALRLYSYWRSSAAYRVRIALNLKGLAFETVAKHLLRDGGEQRQAGYLELNPQGLIPALEDDGFVVSQSLAICEYLEERYPTPPLLPADAHARATVRAMTLAVACDIHPLNNLRVMEYVRDKFNADPGGDWYRTWIQRGFAACEAYASDGPYVVGDKVTLADALLVPQMYNARRFKVPLEAFPKLTRIVDNCNELLAFRDAAPEAQPDAIQ